MNVLYQRSPRIKSAIAEKQVEILRPPNEPNKPSFTLVSIILPVVMTLFSIGFYMYMNFTGRLGAGSYMMFQMVFVVMMLTSYTIPFLTYLSNKKKYNEQLAERTKMYHAELDKRREELEAGQKEQVDWLYSIHGDPDVCFHVVKNRLSSLWERSPGDDDFLQTRIGSGNLPFYIKVSAPRPDGYSKDLLFEDAQKLAEQFQSVSDAPIALPLHQAKVIGIVGKQDEALNALRVVISQLCVRHSPDEVKLVTFYEEKDGADWDWMRWLPHTWDDHRTQRYMADRSTDAHRLADELFQQLARRKTIRRDVNRKAMEHPLYLVVLSDSQLIEEEPLLPLLLDDAELVDCCTIVLSDRREKLPMQCRLVVEVEQGQGQYSLKQEDGSFVKQTFETDRLTLEQAESLARNMAPIRLKRSLANDIPGELSLFELMELGSVHQLEVKQRWRQNRYPESLAVPIGVRVGGKKVLLNIHDKIERAGHGPHGLIAGTTGSGKSEVIRSIVATLASEFHPHDVAFMLIDYKGGEMSNTFDHLPHVIGTITNLSSSLMERAKISLKAELVRRQKILNESGNLQHIDEYYQLLKRQGGQPLPHLVIIIDEFAQLKKDHPEFMDELISIAAIGRTLGLHLILATQKPGGVVDDKIWSNARFRICLRVQDEGDSRDMLKIPNAAWINKPGRGYFQVGSDELFEEVQFAWSGAPYIEKAAADNLMVRVVRLDGKREELLPGPGSTSAVSIYPPRKQLHAFIETLEETAKKEQIAPLDGPWLPPLPETLEMDDLHHDDLRITPEKITIEGVIGLIDDIPNQNQRALRLSIEHGHYAIYGMPGTGKTTLIQSLLMSLAHRYSPQKWNGYIVDMGRNLRDFAGLPQIGAVMKAEEEDRIQRLFRFLTKMAAERKELLADAGVKTAAAYRLVRPDAMPQVLVIIDGYLNFRNNYPDENEILDFLLREGGSLGMTFIVTANRISDIFDKIRGSLANAIAFELADPGDYYYIVGRLSKMPGQLPPGRGLVKGNVIPLEFQVALPACGMEQSGDSCALRNRVEQIYSRWPDESVPTIQALPDKVVLRDLLNTPADYSTRVSDPSILRVPVGISADDLELFDMNLQEGPHFIVAAPMEGGKTTFLLTWMLSLAYHIPPEELHIYTVDARSGGPGLGVLSELPHVQASARREEELGMLIHRLYEQVMQRSQHAEGPALLLMIDDADVLSKQLQDFTIKDQLGAIVRQGRDRNVHVVLSGVAADFPTFGVEWFNDVKSCQTGFLLGTLDPADLSYFRIPISESNRASGGLKILPQGQGYYIKRKYARVKAAIPFDDQWNNHRWIAEIRDRWHVVV